MLKEIFDHIPQFSLKQEIFCAGSKSELIIKTSKSCDLNFANSGRDTEAKTSPRHLNFLKQMNKKMAPARNKNYQNTPLQAIVATITELKARAGIIFCDRDKSNDGTPGDKSAI